MVQNWPMWMHNIANNTFLLTSRLKQEISKGFMTHKFKLNLAYIGFKNGLSHALNLNVLIHSLFKSPG